MRGKAQKLIAWAVGLVVLGWWAGQALGEELTWEQYVQLALSKNPALQAAQAQQEQAWAKQKAAYQDWWPQLTAGAAYQQAHSKNKEGDPALENTTKNYQLSLTASYALFSGGATIARGQQAAAAYQVAVLAWQIAAAELSYALKTAVTEFRYGENNLKLAQDIVKRRQRNLDLVNLLFKGGRENKGSYLLSQAYLEQAKYDVLAAQDGKNLAQTKLAQIVGYEPAGEFSVKGKVAQSNLPSKVDFKKSTQEHPAYQQAILNFTAADANVTSARSSFFPTVGLTGSIGKSGEKWAPKNEAWTVGANISWPLFRGGSDYYQVMAALAERRQAKFLEEDTWHELYAAIQKAHQIFKQATEKVKVYQAFASAGKVRADIARTKYNNGMITFDEWDKIENDYISHQKSLLQGQRDLSLAAAAWEKALGQGVIKDAAPEKR